jgi:hypothetical protein
LNEDRFEDRHIIKAGTNYVSAVNAIIISAGVGYAQVTPSNYSLTADCEFEGGTTKLAAINTLLAEINYTDLYADEYGMLRAAPYILPFDAEVDYIYRTDDQSVILEEALDEFDLFSIPNKWVVFASNPDTSPMSSVYINDKLTSVTSTVNRGRTITQYVQLNNVASQATLDNYARRLAYESGSVYDTMYFRTAAMPYHGYLTNLFIDHKIFGIAAKFQEESWSMALDAAEPMKHVVKRVIFV